jgi:hypothetical protein
LYYAKKNKGQCDPPYNHVARTLLLGEKEIEQRKKTRNARDLRIPVYGEIALKRISEQIHA